MNPIARLFRKFLVRTFLQNVGTAVLIGLLSNNVSAQTHAGTSQAAAAIKYLALGDSFTIGTGLTPADSYPAQLAEALRAAGKSVELKNLGVNGYTTDVLIERELPEVPRYQPTLVTLAIGANDIVHQESKEDYRKQIRKILKTLTDDGVKPKQIIALPQPDWSLSPAASSFGEPTAIAALIAAFNSILKEETVALGGRYVDLFPLMHQEAEAHMLAGDGLHPSKKAYAEWMAPLFAELKRGGELSK